MPPTSGTSQKTHSCCSAQVPWKIATPVLRAGLTEVLVTGMLDQVDQGQRQADRQRANPAGARLSVTP